MTTYITRRKAGKNYHYFYQDQRITDESELERINKLVIPPAWDKVEIAKAKSAKIQARGYDSAGRLQSIYHPAFRMKQEKLKFDRILRFAEHLPELRRQVEKDLARKRLGKDKVLACIIKLIDEAYFRVGSDRYAKEHQTYGVTTLRSKHAQISRTHVTFDFIGKSGKEHIKTIDDPTIARIIKQLDELPGYEIFRYQDTEGKMHDIHPADVNEYIKKYMGEEFTAKDFRTWGGTLLATSAVIKDELEDDANETARKRAVASIVKRVAKRLGNTPAVARSSYIDPRVIIAYEDESKLSDIRKAITIMKPKKYLSIDEQCVLKLLQQ
ncbi:MAG: topoisomerase [Candidatus Saccharibacteria bacterium]|nr:topoisomerase [Candidatus Saccharibacteria bacterium]MDB5180471.1 topoisomerase [Candidatus Saccharibacteria bacterium]